MRNVPLPREVVMPSDRSWRERRRRRRYPVVTSATLKPVASDAFDAMHTDLGEREAIAEQLVVVHDVSLDGLGLRARQPLDLCSHYRIQCEDRNVFLRTSKLRVVSCRRGHDGMYDIGAQLCSDR
jgi:hypothetical protein